ncbi:hypothetical protein [Mesorhizobium tianshanense]|uniref:hypothetical protein n=1 Tax=Mesorhizobium tianshanense TaxID=39844 RepID=UPI00119D0B60|nr:hypothetical protein [Mesorhizobium tianshanense]
MTRNTTASNALSGMFPRIVIRPTVFIGPSDNCSADLSRPPAAVQPKVKAVAGTVLLEAAMRHNIFHTFL